MPPSSEESEDEAGYIELLSICNKQLVDEPEFASPGRKQEVMDRVKEKRRPTSALSESTGCLDNLSVSSPPQVSRIAAEPFEYVEAYGMLAASRADVYDTGSEWASISSTSA